MRKRKHYRTTINSTTNFDNFCHPQIKNFHPENFSPLSAIKEIVSYINKHRFISFSHKNFVFFLNPWDIVFSCRDEVYIVFRQNRQRIPTLLDVVSQCRRQYPYFLGRRMLFVLLHDRECPQVPNNLVDVAISMIK